MSKTFIIFLITILFIKLSFSKDYSSLYNDKERKQLDSACMRNPTVCPMIPAIEDIFKQIQEEEIEAKSDSVCNNLCLTYSSIHIRDMICEKIKATNDTLTAYSEINFINCSILVSGEIGYENRDYKSINFGNFLSELKIPSLIFYRFAKIEKINFNYINATEKFNYDKNKYFFKSMSEDLIEHMNVILNKVYDEFINKLTEKVNPILRKEDILSRTTNKLYEMFTFFDKGPSLFDETKNVTYISYNKIDQFEKIVIKDKIFFYNLNVEFQYALNNNITFNEGFFSIRTVDFESDTNKNNNYYDERIESMTKQAAVIDKLSNSKEIWTIIINDFKNKFNEIKMKDDIVNTRSKLFF